MRTNDQPEYWILHGMKQRCYYEKNTHYPRYGGRGIKICDRWKQPLGIWNFIEDMGRRPSRKHTVERIDNDGDYTPDNCKWATYQEQARNRKIRSDNKVGLSGINYDKTNKRWVARKTRLDGKRVCLGYFKDIEEAKKAVLAFGLL